MSNWKQIPLVDLISTMKNGSNASQNKSNNGLPITRIETISDEFINWKKVGYIKKISKSEFEKHKIRKGDILFSHINSKPHIGKTAIYSDVTNDLIHGINLLLIRANDRVNPNFLLYALRDKKISGYFASISSQSVNQASINQSQMKKVNFLIPSIDLQKQIAQILSTLQNKVELVDKQIKLYEELKKSTMEKLFSEGLRGEKQKETEIGLIPESWEIKGTGEIAKLQSGGTPSRKNESYWKNGNINWVKTGEIKYCVIPDTEEKITELGLKNSSAKLFPKGSLLMAMYGQGVTRGKVAILGIEAATNQACVCIAPINSKSVSTQYLYYYYQHAYDAIRDYSHGAQQKNLSANLIKSIFVPIPSFNEQKEISDILEKLDQKINKLTSKKKSYQQLFNSMLHKLMNQEIEIGM